MVWSGLGVNYKAAQSNWATDMAYFNSIGLTGIRPHMADLPTPWSNTDSTYTLWRNCAKTFANAGFWVTWGPSGLAGFNSGHPWTATAWNNYHNSVVAEASYLQSQGIALGDFEIGNEIELQIDNTTLTATQLNAKIRQLAVDVKAVYNLSPISYGSSADNDTSNNDWMVNGLGGLDSISLHSYGNIQITGQYVVPGSYAVINGMVSALGASSVYNTEFHLDAGNGSLLALGIEESVNNMRCFYSLLKNSGMERAFIYEWVGYLNADNQFAMKNTDGSYNPVWDILLNDNKRRTFTP